MPTTGSGWWTTRKTPMKKTTVSEKLLRGLLLASLLSGCESSPGASGETHFLCSATADCVEHGGDLVCIDGECQPPPASAGANDSTAAAEGFAPNAAYDTVFVDEIDPAACLPRELTEEQDPKTGLFTLACTVLAARPGPAPACQMERGRAVPPAPFTTAALARLRALGACDKTGYPSCARYRVCDLREASDSCHHAGAVDEIGWCYIDPFANPGDDPSLLSDCSATEQ